MNRYPCDAPRRDLRARVVLLMAFCLVALAHGPARAQAPWEQGKDMRRAVRRVVDFGNNVVRAKAQQNVNLGFLDFGPFSGAYIRKGQSVYEGFLLEPKVQYIFLCAFDDKATDFTFTLKREGNGQEISYTGTTVRDITLKKRVASIIFTPPSKERFRITIGLRNSTGDGSCVGLAVLHKNGVRVPVETLYTVTDHCLYKCEDFTAKLAAKKFVSQFYSGNNVWAVIGAFVKPGFRVTSDPKPYKKSVLTVVGAGQGNMKAVNLFLLGDRADGDGNFPVVAQKTHEGKDIDVSQKQAWYGDPWAAIVHEATAGTYMVGLENGDAANAQGSPGLVVAATLTVEPGEGAETGNPTPPQNPKPKPNPEPEPKTDGTVKSMRVAGTWKHNENDSAGTLDFTIKTGGKLTGLLVISPREGKKEMRGNLTGTFNFDQDTKKATISFQIEGSYSGRMNLILNENGRLTGTMNFYDEEDKKVGSAEVDLEVKNIERE
jgi:hypothetical protein